MNIHISYKDEGDIYYANRCECLDQWSMQKLSSDGDGIADHLTPVEVREQFPIAHRIIEREHGKDVAATFRPEKVYNPYLNQSSLKQAQTSAAA